MRHLLKLIPGADAKRAAAGPVRFPDHRRRRNNLAAARIVRGREHREHVIKRRVRLLKKQLASRSHFPEVMRRNFRCHTDRDAARAIQQYKREPRREHRRFLERPVVIRDEVHRAKIDFRKQQFGNLREAGFRVTHGGRAITVTASEVSVTIHKRIPEAERLRHADHGVVRRLIAVRMEFTEHIADHTGGLHIILISGEMELLRHIEEDSALHRLMPVADIRERSVCHHRNGVIEIRAAREPGERQLPLILFIRLVLAEELSHQLQGRRFFSGFGFVTGIRRSLVLVLIHRFHLFRILFLTIRKQGFRRAVFRIHVFLRHSVLFLVYQMSARARSP